MRMKILVTGAAGFIGAALVERLLGEGHVVVGLDNLNDYYAPALKLARLCQVGLEEADIREKELVPSTTRAGYRFVRADICDRQFLPVLFAREEFDVVVNLAGQACVRHSIDNPFAYVESNVVGFLNVLECCRREHVGKIVYASSSSVYGTQDHTPYEEADRTDMPLSLYAATKKTDELMANAYANLYGLRATGCRFFTVYGPWGRPDMAPFIFLRAILKGQPIRVFGHGQMERDFTYIDDIIRGLLCIIGHPATGDVPHTVYNIGRGEPVGLLRFIHTIEQAAGRKAVLQKTDMQPGDVVTTFADTASLQRDFGYLPKVSIDEGIQTFVEWYKEYYMNENSMKL